MKNLFIFLTILILLTACSKPTKPYIGEEAQSILTRVTTYKTSGNPVSMDITKDYLLRINEALVFLTATR